ncbi:MAG: radical SAM protein [Archangium sp.]|nr:radical SAM protein [Archangium sp.]
MELRLAQVVPDTEAEGPGRRFAVWVQGCSLRCPGCCNPEMFVHGAGGEVVSAEALARRVLAVPALEGVSFLGGEPFEQAAGLAEVAARVRSAGLSVMVYSGYTLAELHTRRGVVPGIHELLAETDVLVDGRYDASKPDRSRRWVGSENQVVHFLSSRYSAADERFSQANSVEFRWENGRLTVNGWPAGADAARPGRRGQSTDGGVTETAPHSDSQ